MSWWNTGFDSQKEAYSYDEKSSAPRRLWMPPDTEKKVLMLDEDPKTYWEHNFKYRQSWQWWEPCKIRNRLDNDCAVCDRYPDRKPSFIGMFSCINLTPWETKPNRDTGKTKTFCYGRELVVAKMGSKDKPGMLKRLERLRQEHGGLTGCIFKVYRAGSKTESIGDEWTLIEKIPRDEIVERGKKTLAAWVKEVNKTIDDPENYLTLEKLWERAPWVPFDYNEILKIRSNDELKLMLGTSTDDDDDDGGSGEADNDAPY